MLCQWEEPNDLMPCWTLIGYDDVSEHYALVHGIRNMTRTEKIQCYWQGCKSKIIRHNFVRHIRETHLGYDRP